MTYEDLIDLLAVNYSDKSADAVIADIAKRKREIEEGKAAEIADARKDLIDTFDFYIETLTGEKIPDKDKKLLEDQFEQMELEVKKYEKMFAEFENSGKKKIGTSNEDIDAIIRKFVSKL